MASDVDAAVARRMMSAELGRAKYVRAWLRGFWPRRRYWIMGKVGGPTVTFHKLARRTPEGRIRWWCRWMGEPVDWSVDGWERAVVTRTGIGCAVKTRRAYDRAIQEWADPERWVPRG